MRTSLLQWTPLSVAFLSVSWIPTVYSMTTGSQGQQRWVIPRDIYEMQNIVVDVGMDKLAASGTWSDCNPGDFSNQPILSFNKIQPNQTYLAAGLSFVINTPLAKSNNKNHNDSKSSDPVKILERSSRSPIHLSYLQTSMHQQKKSSPSPSGGSKHTILTSDVDPLVPFKLPHLSPSPNQIQNKNKNQSTSTSTSILFIALVYKQPHHLKIEDCYTKEFSQMRNNGSVSSKNPREDYNFSKFWKSAALGEVHAAGWVIIPANDNNDKDKDIKTDCSTTTTGGGISTKTKGGAKTSQLATTFKTTVKGKPTTLTTTIPVLVPSTEIEGTVGTVTATDETLTAVTPASSLPVSGDGGGGGEDGAFVGGNTSAQESTAKTSNKAQDTKTRAIIITTVLPTTDKKGKSTTITTTSTTTIASGPTAPDSSPAAKSSSSSDNSQGEHGAGNGDENGGGKGKEDYGKGAATTRTCTDKKDMKTSDSTGAISTQPKATSTITIPTPPAVHCATQGGGYGNGNVNENVDKCEKGGKKEKGNGNGKGDPASAITSDSPESQSQSHNKTKTKTKKIKSTATEEQPVRTGTNMVTATEDPQNTAATSTACSESKSDSKPKSN